jgi:hypothetical protein
MDNTFLLRVINTRIIKEKGTPENVAFYSTIFQFPEKQHQICFKRFANNLILIHFHHLYK